MRKMTLGVKAGFTGVPLPTRLTAALPYLKHLYTLSDENTVQCWIERTRVRMSLHFAKVVTAYASSCASYPGSIPSMISCDSP